MENSTLAALTSRCSAITIDLLPLPFLCLVHHVDHHELVVVDALASVLGLSSLTTPLHHEHLRLLYLA